MVDSWDISCEIALKWLLLSRPHWFRWWLGAVMHNYPIMTWISQPQQQKGWSLIKMAAILQDNIFQWIYLKENVSIFIEIVFFKVQFTISQHWFSWWFDTEQTHFNYLCAKFWRGNINIYLHLMSSLHIDMTRVLTILPQVKPGPTYSTQSISWLLMSWRRREPGHQRPWYWRS